MLWWTLGTLVLLVVAGCEHVEPPPPVPPPLEDLSTWSVPELVQPPLEAATKPLPAEAPATKAEQVVLFAPGTTTTVSVPVGWPLDILLERGELVRNIAGGDRAPAEGGQTPRWEVKEGAEGTGDGLRPHLFLTATEPALTMGLIVTTTRRTYYLACQSVKTSPIRVLRWRYSPEPRETPPLAEQVPALLPDPAKPTRYHVGYELTASQPPPAWVPRHIVDDGKKLYIIYPEVVLFESVPLLRLVGPGGPQLLNARQYLNVVIVDQLVGRAELRVGLGERAETVTLTRGALRTITCPGDEACPVWPQAAVTLAGRHP
jgi:type IV secretion system protein TrbG